MKNPVEHNFIHADDPLLAEQWSTAMSAELYGVNDWGAGHFDVSPQGEMRVVVNFSGRQVAVPLIDIVQGMRDRGLDMPVILRIENLLDYRITLLNEAFNRAINDLGYQNTYRGVYPIKVNQQCHVVEEIADFGRRYHHGFEVGSKAELIIALSHLRDHDGLIICNGYKDTEFIELALFARELGIRCIQVLETAAELSLLLDCSARLGIEPLIGVRIRSTVEVDGHWEQDSGDRSIFGLSSSSLMHIVEQLKRDNMLHCLQLLHCHLGSQIPNIRNIRAGVLEMCRYYSELIGEGAPMGFLDIGGGLAVDYEGTSSNSEHSMNYQLDEYCVNIVETIRESLDPLDIPHPVLISESGRATIAYSSLLLFNVLEVRDHQPNSLPEALPDSASELLHHLLDVYAIVNRNNIQECYNDALYYRDEVRSRFLSGQSSLRDRALADNINLAILERIAHLLPHVDRVPPELRNLPELLSDIYYGNFSLFQSLPDSWALDHIFPVMPIHRLDEQPTRQAIIADLTCDCDGKIDHFATREGYKKTISLHPFCRSHDYFLGVFLVGAYQETLGDLHNLFGDTHVVSVKIKEDGSFDYAREFHGDSISDVLRYVNHDPEQLLEKFQRKAEHAVNEQRITDAKRQQMLRAFTASLQGYTYFEQ